MYHPLCPGGGGDIPALSDLTVAPLNGTWWALIALTATAIAGIWLVRGRGRKSTKDNRRFLLSFNPEFDFQFWNELPLQPCNLIAILAILAAATDWQVLKNFCLCAGIPFAMVALLMPVDGFSQVPLFSVNAIGFYGFHGMVLALSVSFATLGVCRSRLRDIPGTAALLVGLGTAVHGVNVLLRATVFGGANYFYTFGLEGNVVLEGLWALLPVPLVYELPLLLVLIAVCLVMTLLARLAEGRRKQNC